MLAAGFLLAAVLCIVFPAPALSVFGGYTWTEVTPHPTTKYLYDICAVAEDDIWAVGKDGAIVHYDGDAWSASESHTDSTLYGVSASHKDDIWSVGQ